MAVCVRTGPVGEGGVIVECFRVKRKPHCVQGKTPSPHQLHPKLEQPNLIVNDAGCRMCGDELE